MSKEIKLLEGYGTTGGDVIRTSTMDVRGRISGIRSCAQIDREEPEHRTNPDGSLRDSRFPDGYYFQQLAELMKRIRNAVAYIKKLNGDPDGRADRARALAKLDEIFEIVSSVWLHQSGRNDPPGDERLMRAAELADELHSFGRVIARLADDQPVHCAGGAESRRTTTEQGIDTDPRAQVTVDGKANKKVIRRHSQDERNRALGAAAAAKPGTSIRKLAKQLGISKSTLASWPWIKAALQRRTSQQARERPRGYLHRQGDDVRIEAVDERTGPDTFENLK